MESCFKAIFHQTPSFPLLVRQIEAGILTVSRDNSILVLSCPFKVSKYSFECWPR